MALIEIDGLPFLNSMVIFHGYVSHKQMVPNTNKNLPLLFVEGVTWQGFWSPSTWDDV